MNIFDFLPIHCFLPISHVSSRFRSVYIEGWPRRRSTKKALLKDGQGTSAAQTAGDEFTTDPMSIGNLFASPWRMCTSSFSSSSHQHYHHHQQHSEKKQYNSPLNTSLLQYYISNGYGKNSPKVLKKVMLSTISRGDIDGMHFMVTNGYSSLFDDENLCTMAGAAGQLEALMWLRGELDHEKICTVANGVRMICPWNPTEVHREAAENSHDHVLEYVERSSEGHLVQTHYGVGLPW
jgi:hypothetical protein